MKSGTILAVVASMALIACSAVQSESLETESMEDCTKLPQITEELLRRGYSEPDIKKILGGNILRVMEDVAATSARLKQS